MTPRNPDERGSQLSIRFKQNLGKIHKELEKRGVVVSVLMIINYYNQNRIISIYFIFVNYETV